MWNPFRPKSVWVVHNPKQRARLCHKIECECCPPMGRPVTYDIVKEGFATNSEGEIEDIIMRGVSESQANADDVKQRVKRIGAPTIQYHPLGVVAAFTSKKKALAFIDSHFREQQDQSPDSLELSEIKLAS